MNVMHNDENCFAIISMFALFIAFRANSIYEPEFLLWLAHRGYHQWRCNCRRSSHKGGSVSEDRTQLVLTSDDTKPTNLYRCIKEASLQRTSLTTGLPQSIELSLNKYGAIPSLSRGRVGMLSLGGSTADRRHQPRPNRVSQKLLLLSLIRQRLLFCSPDVHQFVSGDPSTSIYSNDNSTACNKITQFHVFL